ncbi:gas vesicle accessory protein GvpU [Pseudomonas sp. NFACC04-2]|uniref:gas vesicle accessory protein GvpU n=1 Tax=Pseudomonas sp. NFACC04-2 TaxID=1566242 RepID=UPI0011147AE5|nr:gas vesicle accessory protein GvpU [Pseudomonas sp. NFACC04-2]
MSENAEGLEAVEELREDLSDLVILKGSWEGRGIDDTLQSIVHIANDFGIEASISLTIGGSLVTGILISVNTYFDQVIAGFAGAAEGGVNSGVDTMTQLLTARRPPGGSSVPSQYLHLKDAKVYNGGNVPIPGDGTLWRGKISSVDGFFFGIVRSISR